MVNDKDVILAIVPGALTLSALALVLVGLVASELSRLRDTGEQPDATRHRVKALRYLSVGTAALVTLGLLTAGMGLLWLIDVPSRGYAIFFFFLTLVYTAVYVWMIALYTVIPSSTTNGP